jgi:hypothetical protein
MHIAHCPTAQPSVLNKYLVAMLHLGNISLETNNKM